MVTISVRRSRAFTRRVVKRKGIYLIRNKVLCRFFIVLVIASTLIINIVYKFGHKKMNDEAKVVGILGKSSESDSTNLPPHKKPCAFLFFGLLEDFKDLALPTIQRNIIGPNPHCDVFLHTYNVDKVSTNGANIDPNQAYLLTKNVIIESVDSFELQRGAFLEHSRKHYFQGGGECCVSHDEMIKQWHSIAGVWNLMRQHEKKKVGHLNASSNEDHHYYQQIGVFRSDVYQVNPIDIFNSNAAVPNFSNHGGYNDQFFYGSYQNAALWANRFGFASIFEENYMDNKGENGSDGYHSGYYLRCLMKHNNVIVDLKDVCISTVHSGRRLQVTDCDDHSDTEEFQSNKELHEHKLAPEGSTLEKEIKKNVQRVGHWSNVWDEPFREDGDVGPLKVDTTKVVTSDLSSPGGVVVLGMFHSGAAMLTGLLAEGYNFHVGNTNEEFELTCMTSQNDAFLWGQGLTSETNIDKYVHERSWENLQQDALPTACGAESLKQIHNQMDQAPWLVNDPRLSITLPTWLPLLKHKPFIIYTYRDPMEAALLLQKEQGFELGKGLLLWILYNMSAIQNSSSDDICRIISTNHAMITNPLAELDRIVDELTKCGLSRPRMKLHHNVLNFFTEKYGTTVNKTSSIESLSVRVSSDATTGDCKVYEHYAPGDGDGSVEDAAEASLYSKATKIYCDLEKGVAYNKDYVWPEITDEERNLYLKMQLNDNTNPSSDMDPTAVIEKQLRERYHNCKTSGENTDSKTTRKTDKSILDIPRRIIEVVVAYCKADISWMYDDIIGNLPSDGSTTVKMTILSKCDNKTNIPDFVNDPLVSEVNVIPLSNVGGCDYAYAHFINDYVSRNHTMEDAMSSVILFIKDTPRTEDNFHFGHQAGYRNVGDMIRFASDGGDFICGVKTDCDVSPYHSTADLYNFTLEKYTRISELNDGEESEVTEDFNIHDYANLRDFHERALSWTFPSDEMTPVCYGGTFAVPASRLISLSNQADEKRVFKRLEEILSRKSEAGTTLEEHYVERTWAGLLSTPLTDDEIDTINKQLDDDELSVIKRMKAGIYGALRAQKRRCFKELMPKAIEIHRD